MIKGVLLVGITALIYWLVFRRVSKMHPITVERRDSYWKTLADKYDILSNIRT